MQQTVPPIQSIFQQAVKCHQQGLLEQASKGYQHVLARQPKNFSALLYYGVLAGQLFNFKLAATLLARAAEVDPSKAAVHYNLALALRDCGDYRRSQESFEKAIAIEPDAIFYFDLCRMLQGQKRYEEAVEKFDKAYLINPKLPYLDGYRQYTKRSICDWRDSQAEVAALLTKLRDGDTISPAFPLLLLTDCPELHQLNAKNLVADRHPSKQLDAPFHKPKPGGKLRIGYFSSDFRRHPMSYLLAEMFALHDRSRFELVAFAFSPTRDEVTQRVEACFDECIDIRGMPDKAVAQLARRKGIDVAVDLNGHTDNSRPDIFAWRAAPVQVNYLGYPGTSGASYMDYILADRVIIPEQQQGFFTEKVAWLPDSYMPRDTALPVAKWSPNRAELGLPEKGFVYCCYNNAAKISPDTFAVWMNILRAVDDSVLWLMGYTPAAVDNLRAAAERAGVAAGRLVFADLLSQDKHLARYRVADLFLDCLPYNAHTTANDALFMGVPVVTCSGQSFASKVAASLLTTLEMSELITHCWADYERLAIKLAKDTTALQQIRDKLEHQRTASPLFDTGQFTRNVEAAFTHMVEQQRAGQLCTSFSLS